MSSSLKERLARLGPVQVVDHVPSGSPVALLLRRESMERPPKTVGAALALARRGMTLLGAKRAMEEMIDQGRAYVNVPKVESQEILICELSTFAIKAVPLPDTSIPDVKDIRERLSLTQEQFALRYGLDVDAVRNWERGRREPDQAAKNLLKIIARQPKLAEELLID